MKYKYQSKSGKVYLIDTDTLLRDSMHGSGKCFYTTVLPYMEGGLKYISADLVVYLTREDNLIVWDRGYLYRFTCNNEFVKVNDEELFKTSDWSWSVIKGLYRRSGGGVVVDLFERVIQVIGHIMYVNENDVTRVFAGVEKDFANLKREILLSDSS